MLNPTQKDESVETTLVTGKVQLFTGNESTPVAELSPEQKVTFNKKSRSVEVENVKPEIITSWSQGVLMFEKHPLLQHYTVLSVGMMFVLKSLMIKLRPIAFLEK